MTNLGGYFLRSSPPERLLNYGLPDPSLCDSRHYNIQSARTYSDNYHNAHYCVTMTDIIIIVLKKLLRATADPAAYSLTN